LFSEDSPLRQRLFRIVNGTNVTFERFIIFFILLSAVQLALQNPTLDPKGLYARVLYWMDFTSTGIFILEAVSKIITFGLLFNGKPSYLMNPWNCVDFIVVIISMVTISPLANKL
jgi:Ion transport protein